MRGKMMIRLPAGVALLLIETIWFAAGAVRADDWSYVSHEAVQAVDLSLDLFSELDAEEKSLLDDYREAAKRLQSFYENVLLRGEASVFDNSVNPQSLQSGQPTWRSLLKFQAADGQLFRLDEEYVDNTGRNRIDVGIVRPEEQFLLGLDTKTSEYFIKGHAKNLELAHWGLRHKSYHDAPFTDDSQLILTHITLIQPPWVKGDVRRIKSITLGTNAAGDPTATIEVLAASAPDAARTWHSTSQYTFLVRRSWALSTQTSLLTVTPSAEMPDGYSEEVQVHCRYSNSSGPIPLLARYERTKFTGRASASPDGLTPVRRDVFTVTDIVPGGASRSDFDVRRLLGRNFPTPAEKPAPGRWWILALNGVVLFLIGVILLVRKKSRPFDGGSARLTSDAG